MQAKVLKYILDIEVVIENHLIKQKTQNNFHHFSDNIILQLAVERDLEIIGEAVRKIMEINPDVRITASKNIIILRNIIS